MSRKILLWLFALAVIFFADSLLLILVGCTASVCGAMDAFYCMIFCNLVKGLMVLSVAIPAFFIAKSWLNRDQVNVG